MIREEILKKYKEEEKIFISKILDKIELSDKRNNIENTDFLNMSEQVLAERILNKTKRKGILYGGFEEAERKMLFVFPKNSIDNKKIIYDEYIGIIRIILSNKIKEKYVHRNYLSAIMKLGLKREKIGDIIAGDNGADIIASKEIIKFLYTNLALLKRFEDCDINEMNIENLKYVKQIPKNKTIQVSSMRFDNIVSELANTSRKKASELLSKQKVFLNYVCEIKGTKLVKEKDIITIRGKGRFIVDEITGNTKKGKFNIKIEYFS